MESVIIRVSYLGGDWKYTLCTESELSLLTLMINTETIPEYVKWKEDHKVEVIYRGNIDISNSIIDVLAKNKVKEKLKQYIEEMGD